MGRDTRISASIIDLAVAVFLLLLPGIAHAQHIPTWMAAAAVSPVIVLILAVILGVVSRNWRVGLAHSGLILVWVLLFGLASYFVENDYVIWTPLILYAAHTLIILALITIGVAKRIGDSRRKV